MIVPKTSQFRTFCGSIITWNSPVEPEEELVNSVDVFEIVHPAVFVSYSAESGVDDASDPDDSDDEESVEEAISDEPV